MKKITRKIIYPKDIQIYTGKSRYTAYRMLLRIKKKLNKSNRESLTIAEYCNEAKIDEAVMMEIISSRS